MCECAQTFLYRAIGEYCSCRPHCQTGPCCDWTCQEGIRMGCSCSQQLFGVIDTSDPVHLLLFAIIIAAILYAVWAAARCCHREKERKRRANDVALVSARLNDCV